MDEQDLVRAAAERLDLPVVRMVPLIRTPLRTVRHWQRSGAKVPGAARLLLELIAAGKVRVEDLTAEPPRSESAAIHPAR